MLLLLKLLFKNHIYIIFFSKSSSPLVPTFPVALSGLQPPLLKKFKMATLMRQPRRHSASQQPLKNRFLRQQQLIGVYTTRGKYISNDDAMTPTFLYFFKLKESTKHVLFIWCDSTIKWHKRLFACTYTIHIAIDSGMVG